MPDGEGPPGGPGATDGPARTPPGPAPAGEDGVRIRPAVPADGPALGRLHVRAWRHAYAEIVDPEVLADLDEDGCARVWLAAVADAEHGAPRRVLVAELAGELVGLVAVRRPAEDGDLDQGVGELDALYVAPHAQGAGLGRRLHDAALGALVALGATDAVLHVFSDAFWARELYASAGWRPEPGAPPREEVARLADEQRWRRGLEDVAQAG